MIRNFVFDLGGVLIDLDVQKSINAFMQLLDTTNGNAPVTGKDLLGGGETKFVQLYQTGDISTEDFVKAIQQLCKPETTPEQVIDAWYAMLIGMPAHRLDVLRQIKQSGANLYILSNINDSHVIWTLNHLSSCGLRANKRCVAERAGEPCFIKDFAEDKCLMNKTDGAIETLHESSNLENSSSLEKSAPLDVDLVFFSNEMHLAKPDHRIYDEVLRITGIKPEETLYIDDLEPNIQAGKTVGFNCLQALGDEWIEPVMNLIHTK